MSMVRPLDEERVARLRRVRGLRTALPGVLQPEVSALSRAIPMLVFLGGVLYLCFQLT